MSLIKNTSEDTDLIVIPEAELPYPINDMRFSKFIDRTNSANKIILGVWLSSNYAALACPDFPTCHGTWLPPADYAKGFNCFQQIGPDYLGGQMDVESRIAIHFVHRLGAIAVSIVFLLLSWRFFKENYPLTSLGFASLITFQIVLGISNIYFQVPLYVAIAHNLGALFLLMYLSFVRLKSSTISPA